jgi:ketosteroid isomerase-like protein
MSTADLAAVIEQSHSALRTFLTGDPGPMKELYSRGDDATLANPFGPPVRGWDQIEPTMEQASSGYRDCESATFERISENETADLAYIVEIERYRARVAGGGELVPVSLRVTTVLRREGAAWRIVHRHADPITSPRSHESVLDSAC